MGLSFKAGMTGVHYLHIVFHRAAPFMAGLLVGPHPLLIFRRPPSLGLTGNCQFPRLSKGGSILGLESNPEPCGPKSDALTIQPRRFAIIYILKNLFFQNQVAVKRDMNHNSNTTFALLIPLKIVKPSQS